MQSSFNRRLKDLFGNTSFTLVDILIHPKTEVNNFRLLFTHCLGPVFLVVTFNAYSIFLINKQVVIQCIHLHHTLLHSPQ